MKFTFSLLVFFFSYTAYSQLLPPTPESDRAEGEARRKIETEKVRELEREITEQAAKKAKEMYLKSRQAEN